MNFQWSDLLIASNEWLVTAEDSQVPQAIYRSIISRAYYAVFHAAQDLA